MSNAGLMADISSNNSEFLAHDYAKAGHVAVAIKATEGLTFDDPKHRTWCLRAGMHHLAIFHYHFARPDLGHRAQDEAAHFLRVAGHLLGPRDYVVLDLERATPTGWSHDPAWSHNFDHEIRVRSRFNTILYSSESVLRSNRGEWLTGHPKRIWDANWSSARDFAPAGYTTVLRQYTDGVFGPEPHFAEGIGRCDMNIVRHPLLQAILAARH